MGRKIRDPKSTPRKSRRRKKGHLSKNKKNKRWTETGRQSTRLARAEHTQRRSNAASHPPRRAGIKSNDQKSHPKKAGDEKEADRERAAINKTGKGKPSKTSANTFCTGGKSQDQNIGKEHQASVTRTKIKKRRNQTGPAYKDTKA